MRIRYSLILIIACLSAWLPCFSSTAGAEYAPFAIMSDSHIGMANSVYAAFIREVERQNIKVIFHTGDAIHKPGNAELWRRFLEITGSDKTLYLAPGNHDIRGKESLAVYLTFFPKPYYSVTDGDTLFLFLNTELPGEEHRITGEQASWLENELQRAFRYKFVFMHEPLYPVIPYHGLDRHKKARDALHRLFVRNGVALVVAGHDHIYRRSEKDGITYVVAGAQGGRLHFLARNGEFFDYTTATRIDDHYFFIVRGLDGETRDEFTVGRSPNP
jgi:3',5'-cyclic AMP phosphodiesterase CpdA